jgi:uncharacterized membrane protein
MNTKTFSKREAIRFGWTTVNANFLFFLKVLTIIIGLSAGLSLLSAALTPSFDKAEAVSAVAMVAFIVFQAAAIVVGILFELGTVRISLDFADARRAQMRDLFMQYRLLWRYFLASLLYNLIVVGGLILFIVPGVMWAIKFQFYSFAIVDESAGVLDSFRRSAALTQGVKWNLLLFWLVIALVVIAGALALVVGLLWAIPVVMVARAFVFRALVKQTPAATAQVPA